MKSVTILTPCYNEEANVEPLYERVREVMMGVGRYNYEHLFIDNASTDSSVAMGLLGEYVGAIHTQLQKRPWAIERERINFEYDPGPPKGP